MDVKTPTKFFPQRQAIGVVHQRCPSALSSVECSGANGEAYILNDKPSALSISIVPGPSSGFE
eukprot:2206294-Lingulodinium_polyedra.AAC.1